MSDVSLTREEVREYTAAWWLLLAVGLVSVAAGVIVLFKPGNSLSTLAVICGILVLIEGVVELVAVGHRSENRGLAALVGVLGIGIGILLIRHPVDSVLAIAIAIGIWLVAIGAIRLLLAYASERRLWNVVAAMIEIVAGIVLVSSPSIAYATLALLIGISFIANGIGVFTIGWVMYSLRREATPPPHHRASATA